MTSNATIIEFLRSPDTLESLELKEDLIVTPSGATYPIIQGIPWLLPGALGALMHWQAKATQIVKSFDSEISSYEKKMGHRKIRTRTKERIGLLLKGLKQNREVIREALTPLFAYSTQHASLLDALVGRPPLGQEIFSYENNLFQDWGWDQISPEGNRVALASVEALLPENYAWGTTLTAGAGACRLPADLHQKFKIPMHIACDINPMLLLMGQKMINGQEVHYFETPGSPIDLESSCVPRHLCQPQPAVLENLYLLFADATSYCFASNAFDTVFTPWFIDIVSMDFAELAKIFNSHLKLGANWINYGPLLFDHRDIEEKYSFEEIKIILEDTGFEVIKESSSQQPYLRSPSSSHQRSEKTYGFFARKVAEVEKPKKRHRILPDWLIDTSQPIPKLSYFGHDESIHRIRRDMLGLIDGRTSLEKISLKVANQFGLSPEQSLRLLIGFLTELHEKSQSNKYRGL